MITADAAHEALAKLFDGNLPLRQSGDAALQLLIDKLNARQDLRCKCGERPTAWHFDGVDRQGDDTIAVFTCKCGSTNSYLVL